MRAHAAAPEQRGAEMVGAETRAAIRRGCGIPYTKRPSARRYRLLSLEVPRGVTAALAWGSATLAAARCVLLYCTHASQNWAMSCWNIVCVCESAHTQCTHAYTYNKTHTHKHTCAHTHICRCSQTDTKPRSLSSAHTHACTHAHMQAANARTHSPTHTDKCLARSLQMQVHVCVCARARVRALVFVCVCVCDYVWCVCMCACA